MMPRPSLVSAGARLGVGLVVTIVGCLIPLGWAEAGLNVWTTTGPEGGNVVSLAIDPKTTGVLYSGLDQPGTVYKTTSHGSIWIPLPLPVPAGDALNAVVIDPLSPTTLYAARANGISKSTNGGASWAEKNAGLTNRDITAIAVDPVTPATLYAIPTGDATDALQPVKSTNGGESWVPAGSKIPGRVVNANALLVDPQAPTTLYAGTQQAGVFKSTDGGGSWAPINMGLPNLGIAALVITPRTPDVLFAGTYGEGVFKTTDGGATWNATGLRVLTVLSLAIDPNTPTNIYAGTFQNGIFKSSDGGMTFSPANSGSLAGQTPWAVAVDPHTATVYASTRSGVFSSSNGGAGWSPVNNGIRQLLINALAGNPQTPSVLYAGTPGGVFKTTDGGGSWKASNSGLTDVYITSLAVSLSTPAVLYAFTGDGVFKSTNAGASWSSRNNGLEGKGGVPVPLAIDPQTPETVYVGTPGSGVFKTTNGGASWTSSSSGLLADSITGGIIVVSLTIDPQTPSTVYAALDFNGIFKSTDGGVHWSPSNSGLMDDDVQSLAIDPRTPTTIYAVTFGRGVFKSTDAGARWNPSNAGLPIAFPPDLFAVERLVIVPQTPITLFVSLHSSQGVSRVFKSSDGGAAWSPVVGNSIPSSAALAVNPSGNCIHTGTVAGVFNFASRLDSECLPPPPLVAAVLPASRSVQVGTGASAFATIINAGSGEARSSATIAVGGGSLGGVTCGITQLTGAPTPFTFQATDPTTNQPIGRLNTPVDIAPGAAQTFVVSLTPTAAFCPLDITFGFNCINTDLAPIITGLNTLLLTASPTPAPDMIALALTPTNDGIVNIPGSTGAGAFVVATTNVGMSGSITVSADSGGVTMPINVTLCQTNPTTAQCLAPAAPTVTTTINTNATPTFAVFVTGSGNVPLDPATNRIFVRFKDASSSTCGGQVGVVTRGATSVAVRTQ